MNIGLSCGVSVVLTITANFLLYYLLLTNKPKQKRKRKNDEL